MDIAPGARAGGFVLEGELGAGGFGVVYRGRHAQSGRRAAIKILHADLVKSVDAVRRFEREVEVVRKIGHPNVVEIYEVGRLEDGRPFFAMEYLEGADLGSRLAECGRLSPEEAGAVLEAVGGALAAAHEAGVVHRDVKASNVFFCAEDGRVLLLDFGVAKVLGDEAPQLTTSWQVLGTPAYRAPEQIGRRADPRSDVYALGALAFHMLTGQPPFDESSATMVQYLHRHARRPRPSSRGGIERAFDEVVVRAMSTEPDDRYASVSEFLQAFRAAAARAAGAAAAPESEVRRVQSLAAYVDVEVSPGGEPERAFDDVEHVLGAARRWLEAEGFQAVILASRSLVAARPLTGDPAADRRARRTALEVARDLVEGAVGRRAAPRVLLHRDEARLEDGRIAGGPILELGGWVTGGQGVQTTGSFDGEAP